ncbi:hypothetical protein COT47_05610 [Candidatus Woesearchaeota archaeon CG08_land_8_20_14_0_20_43_7]|nr:MAG: hypothetical protein COT47_05610 [Candidatus Woesearchaeota archaeon CG08_land_8_20_14_0_20_43_7]
MKSKKSQNLITGVIMFLILNVVFFSIMFIFVGSVGKTEGFIEKEYSRKISLMIDKSLPGTEVSIDISELYSYARNNNYAGNIVTMDYVNNKVIVKLKDGEGSSFYYFSKLNSGAVSIDEKKMALIIKTWACS